MTASSNRGVLRVEASSAENPIGAYARYVGRVGALAMTLGVGAAIATGFGAGMAWADDTSGVDKSATAGASTSESADSTGAKGANGANGANGTEGSPARGADGADGQTGSAGAASTGAVGADGTGGEDGAKGGIDGADGGNGAAGAEADTGGTAPKKKGSHQNSVKTSASTTTASKKVTSDGDSDSASGSVSTPTPSSFAKTNTYTQVQPSMSGGGGQLPSVVTALSTASVASTPEPQAPAASLTSLVTNLVSAFLSPFASHGPAAPAPEPPVMWAMLGWVTRETQRALGVTQPVAEVQQSSLTVDGAAARTLSVAAVKNTAPVAVNEAARTIAEDTVLTVSGPGVLANDRDAEGDPLTALLVKGPRNGTVTLNSDGGYTYTPDANFYGTDSFTYKASDGQRTSNTATATIAVTPVADSPVANSDSYITPLGKKLTVADTKGVLKNDTDVDTTNLSAQLVSSTTHGTLAFTPNGAFTYTPTAGFSGIDTFTYRANGAGQFSAPATVSIKVGVNDPVAHNDTATVAEGGTSTINVVANDTDADGNGSIVAGSVTITGGPSHGAATVDPATGAITYTHDGSETTSDSITYTVKDATNATSNPATVSITVTPVNDAPTAAGDTVTTNEDTPASKTLPGADVDSTNLTYAITGNPTHGAISGFNSSTGAYTYTPNAEDLNVGQTRTDTIKYTVSDGIATSAEATVNITITGVDDAPVATPIVININEDQTIDILNSDHTLGEGVTDVDNQFFTYNVTDTAQYGEFHYIPESGVFNYFPSNVPTGQTRQEVLHYTIDDGDGGTTTNTLTINITGVNHEPTAVGDTLTAVTGTPLNFSGSVLTANDTDPDGDALTVVNTTSPAHGSLVKNVDGTYTYTSVAGFTGKDTFTYRAFDGTTTSSPETTVTVTVKEGPTGVFSTGSGPFAMAVDGTKLYVSNYNENTVTVIDTTTNTVVGAKIPVTGGATVNTRGMTFANGKLYLANDDTVTVIDVNNPAAQQKVLSAPGGPHVGLLVSNGRLYVADFNAGTVSEFDAATGAPITSYPVGVNAEGMDLGGALLFVSSSTGVSVINTDTGLPVDTDPNTDGIQGIAGVGDTDTRVAVSGDNIYVSGRFNDDVKVIKRVDFDTYDVVDQDGSTAGIQGIPVGGSPLGMAVSGNNLYVVKADGTVSVINTTTNKVVGNFNSGLGGGDVQIIAVGTERVYISDLEANKVVAVDITQYNAPVVV